MIACNYSLVFKKDLGCFSYQIAYRHVLISNVQIRELFGLDLNSDSELESKNPDSDSRKKRVETDLPWNVHLR